MIIMLFILSGVVILGLYFLIVLVDLDTIDKAIGVLFLFILTFFFALIVSENGMQEMGAEKYVQHPEKFKIEYVYELKNTTLVVTDTIFTLCD